MSRKSGGDGRSSNSLRRRDGKKSQQVQFSSEQTDAGNKDKRNRNAKAATTAFEAYLPSNEWIGYAVLLVATVAAYAQSFSEDCTFIWDDFIFVKSPQVTTWSGILDLWLKPGSVTGEVHFWPVVYSSFWLEHKLFGGLDPRYCRATNVALHVVNACLLRRLLVRLGQSNAAGWISAIIFALHPVRVESVAWIIERKDTLSALFYLGALLVHPNVYPDRDGPKDGTARHVAALVSLVLYVLGMLTKSIVVSLPFILLLIPCMLRGRIQRREVLDAVPFFAAGVALALFDMSLDDKSVVTFGHTLFQRILIACRAICFYLFKLAWPADLVMIYPLWDLRRDPLWVSVLSVVVVPTALVGLWMARHRLGRGPLAALCFFGATLGPTLGLLEYSYMQYSFVADRYQYLAGIGPVAVLASAYVAAFGQAGRRTRHAAMLTLGLVFVMLAVLTNRQCLHYKDGESFFRHVAQQNPQGFHGWVHLGVELERRGQLEKAAECYEKATQVRRKDMPPHISQQQGEMIHTAYGDVLNRLKRYDEAVFHLETTLEFSPNHKQALNILGNAHSSAGRSKEAVQYYRRAVEIDPANAITWAYLGADLAMLGRLNEAVQPLNRATALNHSDTYSRMNLGSVLSALRKHKEAADQYRLVLEHNPSHQRAKELLDAALSKAKS